MTVSDGIGKSLSQGKLKSKYSGLKYPAGILYRKNLYCRMYPNKVEAEVSHTWREIKRQAGKSDQGGRYMIITIVQFMCRLEIHCGLTKSRKSWIYS